MFNTYFSCLGFFMGAGGMGGPSPLSMSSEKIYPADQPMVFNPQNPNAPPIYPCGICHKEVHDNDQVGFFYFMTNVIILFSGEKPASFLCR